MNKVLTYIKKYWQGPPIAVTVGTTTTVLGEGVPTATVVIKDKGILTQLLRQPSLGFGEAYMNGDIVIDGDLLTVLHGFYQSTRISFGALPKLRHLISRLPVKSGQATKNAQHHYDIGNDFYELWLDESKTYSCAYFETGNESLAEAQTKKRDLICRKARLSPGQTLLDIGCGWGGLVFHAAEKYGVTATGITPAHEQAEFIRQRARQQGLTEKAQVIENEWRSLAGTYDRIVSIGMFEHVGLSHYPKFFAKWHELLKPDGVSVLHTIGRRTVAPPDPWIRKYIFPGGYLPTLHQIVRAANQAGLRVYRVENLRPHYAQTLAEWSKNFQQVRETVLKKYGEEFVRMWWLYLQGSEAGFRWGDLELYQLELYPQEAELPQNRDLDGRSII